MQVHDYVQCTITFKPGKANITARGNLHRFKETTQRSLRLFAAHDGVFYSNDMA